MKRLEKTGDGSCLKALEKLPFAAYRGWATSLISASKTICEKDASLQQEMEAALKDSDNEFDKGLTEAYLDRYYNFQV